MSPPDEIVRLLRTLIRLADSADALAQALLDLRRTHPGGWSSDSGCNRAPLEAFFRSRGVWDELVGTLPAERLLGFSVR